MRHCKYCRETDTTLLSDSSCRNKDKGCNFEITYCRTCTPKSVQELSTHEVNCQHDDLEAKAQRIGLYNLLTELKPWETKAKANITEYIKNFREGTGNAR